MIECSSSIRDVSMGDVEKETAVGSTVETLESIGLGLIEKETEVIYTTEMLKCKYSGSFNGIAIESIAGQSKRKRVGSSDILMNDVLIYKSFDTLLEDHIVRRFT